MWRGGKLHERWAAVKELKQSQPSGALKPAMACPLVERLL